MRFVPLFMLLYCLPLHSQSFEVGVYGGLSYYDGDLAPNKLSLYFNTLRPAYGAFIRANVIRWVSLRGWYKHMEIMGDDELSNRTWRGVNFQTDFDELGLGLEVNLFRLYLFNDRIYAEPYVLGGAGVYRFNPITVIEGRELELQPIGTEGRGLPRYPEKYELTQWEIIGGAGVKIRLSERWILGFDGTGRITFTDDLDDVTGNSWTYEDVLNGNGQQAAELSRPTFNPDRHNPSKPFRRGGKAKDYVMTGGVTISFLFGPDIEGTGRGDVECPTW